MRKEEAEEVIKIMLSADGGCEYCVAELLESFCTGFPDYKELAKTAFRDRFGIKLEDFLKDRYKYAR